MIKEETSNEPYRDCVFPVKVVVDYSVRALCMTPYPGHRRGCPKFNSGHPDCPPDAPLVDEFFDMTGDFYVVVNNFDIMQHMNKLEKAHPTWSERQLRCCLYWQATARKQLAEKVRAVLKFDELRGLVAVTCPEAMGVHVTETLERAGVPLEWPPIHFARQVALLGNPLLAHKKLSPNTSHTVADG